MPRFRQDWMGAAGLACLGIAVSGCTIAPRILPQPPQGPMHLVVREADAGFVIRADTAATAPAIGHAEPAPLPVVRTANSQGPVTLGGNVRIDRRALFPTPNKDIPHGETR